jgi:LysM repeat protein
MSAPPLAAPGGLDTGGAEPAGPPLRLLPGGRDAVLRHRRPQAVYRRRRLVAAVVGAVLLIAALSGASALEERLTASASGASASAPTAAASVVGAPTASDAAADTYVVQAGDTWWSIARSLQPEGDIRGLVDELAAANGGSGLVVGQQVDLAGAATP